MAYQMAPLPATFSYLKGHFSV